MRNAHASTIDLSSKRQRNVFVLAFMLCVWMLAYAIHIHARDDGSATDPSTACSFCISLPVGAAAPAAITLSAPTFTSFGVVSIPSATIVTQDVPSSYRSRAPPAL